MNKSKINILAIESSCDDTSAAVISDGLILSNVVSNQVVHENYGGVVPELASREHQANIVPVIDEALKKANIDKSELSAIAFTRGPGLLGSLLVGVTFAKAMALSLNIPLVEVHHMHAHVLAHFIEDPKPQFPFLCLTVSGGHTQIVKVNSPLDLQIIGTTIDDAAGEAFDKAGKMLGLDYPSGPILDKRAKEGSPIFTFTKPKVDGLDFSFSGLKTSILYFLQKEMKKDNEFINNNLNDLCCSIQTTIVDILIQKLRQASIQEGITQLAIAGGVSANSALRSAVISLAEELGGMAYIPAFQYCTDNAAMVAMASWFRFEEGLFSDQYVKPDPRMAF